MKPEISQQFNPTTKEKNGFSLLAHSMLVRTLFIFIAWLLVWQVGRLVEYTEHASVWFPAAGFTFSCLLVLGGRAFVPIMLAAIIITIWNGQHYELGLSLKEMIWGGFLFGLAHIFPYWAGAKLISDLANKSSENIPRLIVSFILVAGGCALLAAILVISSLIFTHQMPVNDWKTTFLPFWIGDMAGVIVLTPLFSGLLIKLFPNPNLTLTQFTADGLGSYRQLLYKLTLNAVLIVVTMVLAFWTDSFESSFAIFFLAITHMWIATTETPLFSVISLAVTSVLIVLLVHFLGLMDHVMVYQFAINVIAANALFGIAIPQLKAYNKTLEDMVFTDTMTGVASRYYLEQKARLDMNECQLKATPLSLVVFDLDDFKNINDQFGHVAGDEALRRVSRAAQENLRKTDTIARYGGDEFIVLLPGASLKDAQVITEKIRQAIGQILIKSVSLSSSFGIACWQVGDDYMDLFSRADQALYISKTNGRNQISAA
ncbi:MAG: diguanylate cyclase [Proteobacteria bacterium]|nr:MAG: diguanylate cyclase [Pseudomonadota bacterium]